MAASAIAINAKAAAHSRDDVVCTNKFRHAPHPHWNLLTGILKRERTTQSERNEHYQKKAGVNPQTYGDDGPCGLCKLAYRASAPNKINVPNSRILTVLWLITSLSNSKAETAVAESNPVATPTSLSTMTNAMNGANAGSSPMSAPSPMARFPVGQQSKFQRCNSVFCATSPLNIVKTDERESSHQSRGWKADIWFPPLIFCKAARIICERSASFC